MATINRQMLSVVSITVIVAVVATGCNRGKDASGTTEQAARGAKFARDIRDGKATVKTDDGSVEIQADEHSERVKFKNENGKQVTIGEVTDEDLAKIDIPVYPAAEVEGGHSMTTSDSDSMVVHLKTTDAFDRVAEFYKQQYPDGTANEVSANDNQVMLINAGEKPDIISITISRNEGESETKVVLARQKSASKQITPDTDRREATG